MTKTAISPTRSENYAEWFQQVIQAAEMAQHAPVRGCMVIKPWGYGMWEQIQAQLDQRFKATGHENAYFPLFIPLRYFQKEAEHVEGFAKECAVVTHARLTPNADGMLQPDGPLEEPLVVRPTSETIIGEIYSQWVQSHRDLPILLNQWANVVRWEMRTRLFLRTAEFLWQEGHTAHATREEALEETNRMHQVYTEFCHEQLALPVIPGEKTESERFPGAERTFTIEALMQDGKALQGGTAHFMGQNFAKASNISFLNQDGEQAFAWTTSWGVTTRLIGAMVMTHGDDDGMRVPPRVAPYHVVILPILHKNADTEGILHHCEALKKAMQGLSYEGKPVRVTLDKRDLRGGDKSWQWIKKGIPIRVEIGPRDQASGQVCVLRRDQGHKDKSIYSEADWLAQLPQVLGEIQTNLYQQALHFRDTHTRIVDSEKDFYAFFQGSSGLEQGGFVSCFAHLTPEIEAKLKSELKVSPRCIPSESAQETGPCLFTQAEGAPRILFARAY